LYCDVAIDVRFHGKLQWLQEYAAIGGNPRFCELSAKLAFGEDSSVLREKRNCTVQALSGTGSLRVCCVSFDSEHFMSCLHTV
jgi:aspartate/tyrosine/aromatic aminotransferase